MNTVDNTSESIDPINNIKSMVAAQNIQYATVKEKNKIPSRVFMFEQCDVDVTTASHYGPIYRLFDFPDINNKYYDAQHPTRNNRPCIWDTDILQDYIIQKLEEYEYNAKNDYILIAGHTIPVVMFAVTVALHFCEDNSKLKFLFWSSRDRKYIERRF